MEDKGRFTDRKVFTPEEMEETARSVRAAMSQT
jgi:ParB-like chromosome segregation protein Spo0J